MGDYVCKFVEKRLDDIMAVTDLASRTLALRAQKTFLTKVENGTAQYVAMNADQFDHQPCMSQVLRAARAVQAQVDKQAPVGS